MAKGIGKLSAREVATKATPGHYGDGGGLWLQISDAGTKSWVFRFKSPVTGKAREMGLGSFDTYSLAEARERAREQRKVVDAGRDPIAEREAARQSTRLAAAMAMTFDQCAAAYISAHRAGWKNAKHAQQWENTLAADVSPVIGALPVAAIDTALVVKVLEPIWTKKNETASRLRGRMESVLDWAKVRGYRTGENPARWRGHLDKILAAPAKVQRIEHHRALPFEEVGAFMADLATRAGTAAMAVRFGTLTAARSGEVRGATWDEFDMAAKVWTIPAERMKAEKEHRIPLSDAALAILQAVPRLVDSPYVFPAPRGGMLSDMTLTAVLRRMGRADVTVHGFRSTFRDWAGETTAFPREVIEHALAHRLKDKAEAAYARGTLFDKRRLLMDSWAKHCTTIKRDADNVIGIGSKVA